MYTAIPMRTVAEVFDDLGGPTALGRLIEVNASTANEMKRRGSIPAKHWPKLELEAGRAGHNWCTSGYLARVHALAAGTLPDELCDADEAL